MAIELALHLTRDRTADGWRGARVINADAMQVYRGLDIITNKIPESERQGIEHLLMGFKAPGEQYVVGQWVQDALTVIEDTHNRRQIPIVVGGTSYWIQHLLFPNRLASDNSTSSSHESASSISKDLADSIASLPPHLLALFNDLPRYPPSARTDPDGAFNLYTLLAILDPPIAQRWHWRDTRKILRSLCIAKESGRRSSEIMDDQSKDTTNLPRFRTLCFWLYAEPSVLDVRLNKRVDAMIEQGLLNEIRHLQHVAETPRIGTTGASGISVGQSTDYTQGIYQSIGYKEFNFYLASPEPSEKAFKDAVEHMKLSTRQYSRRQISWIRNKLLPAIYATNSKKTLTPIYLLDATEPGEQWMIRAQKTAIQITEDFLEDRALPSADLLSENARKMLTIGRKDIDPISVLNARRKMICPVCTLHPNRPFMVEQGQEWIAHQSTRAHKRMASKARES